MKTSLNILQKYINLYDQNLKGNECKFLQEWKNYTSNINEMEKLENFCKQLSEKLSALGFPIESLSIPSKYLAQLRIAKVIDLNTHPNNSSLNIVEVEYLFEDNIVQNKIVCGDQSLKIGDHSILILTGEILPSTGKKLKPRLIAGVESAGMLCSAEELSLNQAITEELSDKLSLVSILEKKADLKPSIIFNPDGVIKIYDQDQTNLLNQNVIELIYPNGPEFDIEITYNRGDLLSVFGLAQELVAANYGSFTDFAQTLLNIPTHLQNTIDINRLNHENVSKIDCSFYSLMYFKAENKADLINFSNALLLEIGQPNHVFDSDKIVGKVSLEYSKKGQVFKDLHDEEYILPDGLLILIDEHADDPVISLAGVKGGKRTAYSDETKNIAVELACFDKNIVFKTCQSLNLDTTSSKFFSHGVNKENILIGMYLFKQLLGNYIDYKQIGSLSLERKTINVDLSLAKQLCSDLYDKKTFIAFLGSLGFESKDNCQEEDKCEFYIPNYRFDIDCQEMLIGEYIRLKDYNNLSDKAVFPVKSAIYDNQSRIISNLSTFLSAYLHEVKTLKLVHENDSKLLSNPITGYNSLRNKLVENVFACAVENYKQDLMNNVHVLQGLAFTGLYEIGDVFVQASPDIVKDSSNEKIEQIKKLCIVLKNKDKHSLLTKLQKFFSKIAYHFYALDFEKIKFENTDNKLCLEGYSSLIYYKQSILGEMGLLKHDLKSKVFFGYLEINLDAKELAKKIKKTYMENSNTKNLHNESYDISVDLNPNESVHEVQKRYKDLLLKKYQEEYPDAKIDLNIELIDVHPENYFVERKICLRIKYTLIKKD